MKIRFGLLILALLAGAVTADAQRSRRHNVVVKTPSIVKSYVDSLAHVRERIDSTEMSLDDSRYAMLFTPLTYYRSPANHFLRLRPDGGEGDSLGVMLDKTLMDVYLNRPDLVKTTQRHLEEVGAPIVADSKAKKPKRDIIEEVAPKVFEPETAPSDIVIFKPNFWTFGGDYYLQFLQNYVSDNWYKGGESNYSMLATVTLQANYNNKQRFRWDNKLEMRLGFQNTKGDTLHTVRASEDLIRYTGKVGLQASKKWYYTIQLIASTQFMRGLKSNDPHVYSKFLAPLYVNPSLGMDYNVNWFKGKLKGSAHLAPIAYNLTYVRDKNLGSRFGIDAGKHTKSDFGSEITIDLNWQITKDVRWKTRFYGYTTYKRAIMEWENTFTFVVNKYISSNLFLYPRFDDGVSRDGDLGYWQMKEYISLGFSYGF